MLLKLVHPSIGNEYGPRLTDDEQRKREPIRNQIRALNWREPLNRFNGCMLLVMWLSSYSPPAPDNVAIRETKDYARKLAESSERLEKLTKALIALTIILACETAILVWFTLNL
jgi:hypothetical protein